MKSHNKKNTSDEIKLPFAQKHPRLNLLLGLFLVLILLALVCIIVYFLFLYIGKGIKALLAFLDGIISTSDKVVVVALITGSLSLVGVIISSTVGKILEYRYNVRKYQYEKKEKAYEEFVAAVYKILDKTKKNEEYSEAEMVADITSFSKKLTLWGSNSVIKKWLKFRNNSVNAEDESQ